MSTNKKTKKRMRFQTGWFKGEQFVLFKFALLENYIDDNWELLAIQVAKFQVSLYWS